MKAIKQHIIKVLLLPQRVLIWLYFLVEKSVELIFPIKVSRSGRDLLIDKIENEYRVIHHELDSGNSVEIKLFTPNQMCLFRKNTFSVKEPEMLR